MAQPWSTRRPNSSTRPASTEQRLHARVYTYTRVVRFQAREVQEESPPAPCGPFPLRTSATEYGRPGAFDVAVVALPMPMPISSAAYSKFAEVEV